MLLLLLLSISSCVLLMATGCRSTAHHEQQRCCDGKVDYLVAFEHAGVEGGRLQESAGGGK
jgi:hypothetical protein